MLLSHGKFFNHRENRTIDFPRYIFVEDGASSRFGEALGGFAGNIAVLTQKEVLEKFPVIFDLLKQSAESMVSYELSSVPVARRLMDLSLSVARQHPEVVIGIGGGSVLDSAKYVSYLLNLPLIAVPTLASNDGICSPVASLFLEESQRSSIRTKMPYAVLADTSIIIDSPPHFTMAGIGDIISKLSSLEDWKLSNEKTGEEIDYFAWTLSKTACQSVLHFRDPSLDNEEFIDTLLESLISSGIAIEYAGSSRPASGSEHLLSHAADRLLDYSGIHGIQTGFFTCVVLNAKGSRYYREVLEFLDNLGFFRSLPRQLFDCDLFERVVELAPGIRKRYTFLDIINADDLKTAFDATCSDIENLRLTRSTADQA